MANVEELCQRLVDSELLSSEAADQQLAKWREEASGSDPHAEDFVDWLIEQGKVSEFQGDAILTGHVGTFQLGPYRVYEQVAPGRLGALFRATHVEFDQPVTLKVFPESLKDDPEKVARMGREVRIFAEVDHPNVLRSYEVGRVGEMYYLALEELRGETLAARLERDERLPYREACRIIRDVARGLYHLHQNEVVHRDLRPATIWLSEGGSPKVIEFGAARDAFAEFDAVTPGELVTQPNSEIGQYDYMSPDQAENPHAADARSDIYALGCVLYHCLAGQPPFVEKNPMKLVLQHARETPKPVSEQFDDVPSPVDETLAGMLAKDAQDRFASAEDVAFALDQYVPKEAAPAPAVVTVNQQYLDWVKSRQPAEPQQVSEDAEGISPELVEFLGWMSRRNSPRSGKSQ